jgi:hypothetical protein
VVTPTFPLSYRGGQLVVEYATVCFRSQEDCGPVAGRAHAPLETLFASAIRRNADCHRKTVPRFSVEPTPAFTLVLVCAIEDLWKRQIWPVPGRPNHESVG